MMDLWVSSGHHLLDRDDDGRLRITDEFLKAYLARPEIVPPDEAEMQVVRVREQNQAIALLQADQRLRVD